MIRFLFRVLCCLIPPQVPVPLLTLALLHKLVAMANVLLAMVNIDLLFSPFPPTPSQPPAHV
jgi:hypothetical protein